MPRLVLSAQLFLVLLVGVSSGVIFDYDRAAYLTLENGRVKDELSRETQYLKALEDERRALQTQLNLKGTGYNSEIVELDLRIMSLQSEIESLKYELRCQKCITIGLTFFWERQLDVDRNTLKKVVEWINDITWDAFCIRFFIYHAEPRDFMPIRVDCLDGKVGPEMAWTNEAWTAYPERDIPIGIFYDVGVGVAGCAMITATGYVVSIAVDEYTPAVLSHEILHVLGFTEKELTMVRFGVVIPLQWSARLQERARMFQMRAAS